MDIDKSCFEAGEPAKLSMEDTVHCRHGILQSHRQMIFPKYRHWIRIREMERFRTMYLLTIGQIEDSSVAASPAAGLGFAATDPVY